MRSLMHLALAVPLLFASRSFSAQRAGILLGKVCEERAFAAFEEVYAHTPYSVLRNISYSKQNKKVKPQILGELDILVIDKQGVIVAASEVKYVSAPHKEGKARRKASDQLQRFLTMCVGGKCQFWFKGVKIDIRAPRRASNIQLSLVTYGNEDGSLNFYEH